MMQLLDEMRDEKIHEYNSLVFATYSALRQAKHDQPREFYEAILAGKRNTETLTYELKSLYHNIRAYIRRIQEQNSINDLLENHFEKYKPMTDRIYHPIKTMDSIHRYMAPVRELLAAIREDEELLAGMRKRAVTVRKYERDEEAAEEIFSAIDYVQDTYAVLADIIDEIDRKHSAYTKNSIEKMTYMMTADQSIQGKLLEIFKAYASSGKTAAGTAAAPASEDQREALLLKFQSHVNIDRQEFIDGGSVFHKSILSRRISGDALAIAADAPFSLDAMEGLARQMKNVYSPERIRRFVDSFFRAGETEVESEALPINDDTDFILLILAIVRFRERGMDYTVELKKGRVNLNGYVIPKMIFTRNPPPSPAEAKVPLSRQKAAVHA
jgi:hypothetical protein